MSERSVLVASNYNAWPEAFNGQAYAFLEVIRSVEGADVLAPDALPYTAGRSIRPSFSYLGGELLFRSLSQVRRSLGLTRYAPIQRQPVERDYDLFFFMCQFPIDLASLDRFPGWRQRSTKAVAFILEPWSHLLHTARAELRLLNKFDHVFVFNPGSIRHLAEYAKTPCSYLASATDCLLATPFPDPPVRSIDVYSMGRRSPETHAQLVKLARASNAFFYVYDSSRHGATVDWADNRFMTASLIKRTKFFIAYDHTVVDRGGINKNFQERSLSTRYFEGAAGGAVMLGSAPDCPEFAQYFDWDDAVIEIPVKPEDIGSILTRLNSEPERLERVSKTNAIQSLRRHDWAHRWDEILKTCGLPRSRLLQERLDRLESIASGAEGCGRNAGAVSFRASANAN